MSGSRFGTIFEFSTTFRKMFLPFSSVLGYWDEWKAPVIPLLIFQPSQPIKDSTMARDWPSIGKANIKTEIKVTAILKCNKRYKLKNIVQAKNNS